MSGIHVKRNLVNVLQLHEEIRGPTLCDKLWEQSMENSITVREDHLESWEEILSAHSRAWRESSVCAFPPGRHPTDLDPNLTDNN